MRFSLASVYRPKSWTLALSALALAPVAEAQVLPRPAGRLLRAARPGGLPVAPGRGLPAMTRPAGPPLQRGLLGSHRPAQGPLRKPAPAWPLAPDRTLATAAGRDEAGEASFKPVAVDDPRIRRALEDLRRDGQGLLDGLTLAVKEAWIRETDAGPSVRLKLLMEVAGQTPSDAGRLWLDATREAGQGWRCHAVAAGQGVAGATTIAARLPAAPPTFHVMILCPDTGDALSTGFGMTAEAFLASELRQKVLADCPFCGGTHVWGKEDAYLSSEQPIRR